MAEQPGRLNIAAGVVKTNTDYSQEGRYVDSQFIRFRDGRAQTWMGWVKYYSSALSGVPRSLVFWRDNDSLLWLGAGTHQRLYTLKSGSLVDRTPATATGTLGSDPITTASGSATVTIAHTSHGRAIGDYVVFDGATAVGGLTIDGEYTVVTVPTSGTYTITAASAASSTATGGGASVTYEYLLSPGLVSGAQSYGYGVGPYGQSTYGSARAVGVALNARIWALDLFGENMIASPRGGNVYSFDVDGAGQRAALVTNAPTSVQWAFVTADKHLCTLGKATDLMSHDWSGQGTETVWTPAATNQAGSYSPVGGTRMVAGLAVGGGLNLTWSDACVFTMQYTQDEYVYRIRNAGNAMGLIGPLAKVERNGTVYWMSPGDFHQYRGGATDIPNSIDIRDYVFGRLNWSQREKIVAGLIEDTDEIIFLYPSSDGANTEIDSYVKYNTQEQVWDVGTAFVRTAWLDSPLLAYPLGAGVDGYLYNHEAATLLADGATMTKTLTFAPLDIADGAVSQDWSGFIPDFKDQQGDVTVTLYGKDAPASTAETFGPYTITPGLASQDVRANGRQIGGMYSTTGYFRVGAPRVEVDEAGSRGP